MIIEISNWLELWAIIIGSIGVIGTGLYWIHRKVLKPLHDIVIAAADIISRELQPNHGGSMYDKLDKHIKTENERWAKHDDDAVIVKAKVEEAAKTVKEALDKFNRNNDAT